MADIWSWREELAKAHLTQTEIGKKFFDKSPVAQMSTLVKKMVDGRGLTASERDKNVWSDVLEYIEFKKNQIKQEN